MQRSQKGRADLETLKEERLASKEERLKKDNLKKSPLFEIYEVGT